MAFRHISGTNLDSGLAAKAQVLEQLMIRYCSDPGFDTIELRRLAGRHGYVPTGHKWEDDGQDSSLEDGDDVMLIGGERPAALAEQILDAARAHSDEAGGKRQPYRVVGTRRTEGEQGGTANEMVFELMLPATDFEPAEQTRDAETHDVMVQVWAQLNRQNDFLFKILMRTLERWPDVMGKAIDLIEQVGDMASTNGSGQAELMIKVFEWEQQREARFMAHDMAKAQGAHRKDVFEKAIEVAGPDVVVLIRKIIEMLMAKVYASQQGARQESQAQAPSASASQAPDEPKATNEPKSLGLAARLKNALTDVPEAGIRKARELLSEAEWDLLEAAQRAPSDEEFKAVFVRFRYEFRKRPPKEGEALITKLMACLGGAATLELISLLKTVS